MTIANATRRPPVHDFDLPAPTIETNNPAFKRQADATMADLRAAGMETTARLFSDRFGDFIFASDYRAVKALADYARHEQLPTETMRAYHDLCALRQLDAAQADSQQFHQALYELAMSDFHNMSQPEKAIVMARVVKLLNARSPNDAHLLQEAQALTDAYRHGAGHDRPWTRAQAILDYAHFIEYQALPGDLGTTAQMQRLAFNIGHQASDLRNHAMWRLQARANHAIPEVAASIILEYDQPSFQLTNAAGIAVTIRWNPGSSWSQPLAGSAGWEVRTDASIDHPVRDEFIKPGMVWRTVAHPTASDFDTALRIAARWYQHLPGA